jgi:hypothetical protein
VRSLFRQLAHTPAFAVQATLESLGKVVVMPTSTLGFGAEDLQRLKKTARVLGARRARRSAKRRPCLNARNAQTCASGI